MSQLWIDRVHGGVAARHVAGLDVSLAEVVDFSVNLNPYGPCVPVVQAARAALLDDYPDPTAQRAREAWAHVLGVPRESVVVGHGAADLIWGLVRAFVRPNERVVIAEPTFSEMRVAAAVAGAQVERVFTHHAGLALDLEAVAHHARAARLVYLCSPNNPTGEGLAPERLRAFAHALGDATLVLDQSFLSLSDHAEHEHARLPENVIVLRSLTKDYALAGLRIGYLLAAPALAQAIERARPTWATSAPALAAIERAASERAFVRASWQAMRADRELLRAGLRARGIRHVEGVAGYTLAHVGDAARLTRQLLAHKLFVRDASSFGLSEYVRLAARPRADTERLLAALDGVARGA